MPRRRQKADEWLPKARVKRGVTANSGNGCNLVNIVTTELYTYNGKFYVTCIIFQFF